MVKSKLGVEQLVFLISLVFFISITNGNFWESDSRAVYETARTLVFNGKLNIDCVFGERSFDGQCYSKYGFFMSFVIVPLRAVDALARDTLQIRYFFDGFFSSFTNSFISALLVWLIYKFLKRLDFSNRDSILGAFIFAFLTYVPSYTKTLFSEPVETLLMMGAFYALFFLKNGFVLSGYLFGFALLTKIASISFIPVFIIYFYVKNINFRQLLSFSLPVVICIAIFLGYNYVRFGDILDTGYRGVKFDYPFLKGLYLHLLSPGKSLFLYMPIFLFSFLGIKAFLSKNRLLFLSLLVFSLTKLIFYSMYMHPAGDWTWGSRYIYGVLPLFVISLMFFISQRKSRILKFLFITVCGVSLLIQLASVYLGNHRYYAFLSQKYKEIPWESVYFNPPFSPLINQPKMIFRIGYEEDDPTYWREAFQEYIDFNPNQRISDPDLFFFRSKKELGFLALLLILEIYLIRKLILINRLTRKIPLIDKSKRSNMVGI